MRLFHCENECYVVAVGSFANDLPILQNGLCNVLCKKLFYHVRVLLLSPQSSKTS